MKTSPLLLAERQSFLVLFEFGTYVRMPYILLYITDSVVLYVVTLIHLTAGVAAIQLPELPTVQAASTFLVSYYTCRSHGIATMNVAVKYSNRTFKQ